MSGSFSISPLAATDIRNEFSCGSDVLDLYFREIVTQDIKRRITSCYVAKPLGKDTIAGFYTLSASSIPMTALPPGFSKKLPRYPVVPVARLGRLGVDARFKGLKLGAALIWDAIARSARSEVTVYALAVDAKDETAEAFYRHLGFIALEPLQSQLIWLIGKDSVPG
jgi:GNAT superfamily N-acetyltransferase